MLMSEFKFARNVIVDASGLDILILPGSFVMHWADVLMLSGWVLGLFMHLSKFSCVTSAAQAYPIHAAYFACRKCSVGR